MAREIAAVAPEVAHARTPRSPHLMCRTSLWGIAGFLGCGYFAWLSFYYVAKRQFDWPHDTWTAVTYVVWIILLTALAFDTHCLRERLFFGLLVTNFVIGFALTIWSTIPAAYVRTARLGTGSLWAVAGLMSLITIGRAGTVAHEERP